MTLVQTVSEDMDGLLANAVVPGLLRIGGGADAQINTWNVVSNEPPTPGGTGRTNWSAIYSSNTEVASASVKTKNLQIGQALFQYKHLDAETDLTNDSSTKTFLKVKGPSQASATPWGPFRIEIDVSGNPNSVFVAENGISRNTPLFKLSGPGNYDYVSTTESP